MCVWEERPFSITVYLQVAYLTAEVVYLSVCVRVSLLLLLCVVLGLDLLSVLLFVHRLFWHVDGVR